MRLAAHLRLGRYEILGRLPSRARAESYEAIDTRLDRAVAIRLLPKDLMADPQRCSRFEQDARSLVRLSHPHIRGLYDIDTQEGLDFIVLEHVEGIPLADRLRRGPLPISRGLQLAIEIAGALDEGHRLGFVHGHLCPQSILITESGAKILELGLVELRRTGTTASPVEGHADSIRYRSPEQLSGRSPDPRSDIFAFGAVLYEMMTGRKAFRGQSQQSVRRSVLIGPPTMRKRRRKIPALLNRTVMRCVAPDPEARWQSVRDVKHLLEWLLETS